MARVEIPTRAIERGARSSGALNVIWRFVLVLSIAVLVTMASIGFEYRLADSGVMPIIKAPDGPHWVKPDDDGEESMLSKLSVNELLMRKESPKPPDKIVLASSDPRLFDEDKPVDDILRAVESKRLSEFREAVDASIFPTLPWKILAGGILPVSIELKSESSEASDNFVGRSLRSSPPLPRPDGLTAKNERQGAYSVAADDIRVDESAVQAGAPVVQLGNFQNNAIAESSMLALQITYDDLIGDKKWIIQKTNFGTYSTFRLRITGFFSVDEAVEFCNVLLAKGQDCVPTKQN
ncbi:MAG: hypothetical protein OXI87_15415 [Albidovulum sp.]|nr:hypothetical protein [Albidovulum sp.]MDE0306245.1 hypothetical protein [Albidovulum sp.]MDE0531287.1 hypothetical protein [Albidovulum sp.]